MGNYLRLSEITERLIARAYCGGSIDRSKGLDCFSLVYNYLQDRGVKVPRQYDGYDLQNYFKNWQINPVEAIRTALKFLGDYTDFVSPGREVAGDILFCMDDGFFAIDAGNGYMLAMIENESQMTAKNNYKIRMAFRCRK